MSHRTKIQLNQNSKIDKQDYTSQYLRVQRHHHHLPGWVPLLRGLGRSSVGRQGSLISTGIFACREAESTSEYLGVARPKAHIQMYRRTANPNPNIESYIHRAWVISIFILHVYPCFRYETPTSTENSIVQQLLCFIHIIKVCLQNNQWFHNVTTRRRLTTCKWLKCRSSSVVSIAGYHM